MNWDFENKIWIYDPPRREPTFIPDEDEIIGVKKKQIEHRCGCRECDHHGRCTNMVLRSKRMNEETVRCFPCKAWKDKWRHRNKYQNEKEDKRTTQEAVG